MTILSASYPVRPRHNVFILRSAEIKTRSRIRYSAVLADLRGRGEPVTEETIAAGAGIKLKDLRAFCRQNPDLSLELGVVRVYRAGERVIETTRKRYRRAAERITAHGDRVTYESIAAELGLKKVSVESFFCGRRQFARALGVATR